METIPLGVAVTGVSLTIDFSDREDFTATRLTKTATGAGSSVTVSLTAAEVDAFAGGHFRVKNGTTLLTTGSVHYEKSSTTAASTVPASPPFDLFLTGTGDGPTDRAAINAAISKLTTAGKISGRLVLAGLFSIDQTITIDGGYTSTTQNLSGAGNERFVLDGSDATITPGANIGSAFNIKGFYGPVVNLRFYSGGASRSVADASISSGSGTVTSATAAFTSSDVGKYVRIEGAGNLGHAPYVARITSVTSATVAVTDGTAAFTVSGASLTVQDIALHLENLVNADVSLWASKFAGLVLHLDTNNSTTKYVTQSTFRKVYTLSCGQAISLKNTQGGLGAFLDVWDDNNVHGSVFDTLADTTFLHYENYSPATQTVGVLFNNASNIYISEISLGDRPSEALLKIVGPGFDFGHIDKLRVGGQPGITAGNGVTDGVKIVEVSSLDVNEIASLRLANGVRIMGGGANGISIKRHFSQTADTTCLRIEPGPSTSAPIVDVGVHHRFCVNPVILGALTGGTVKVHGHFTGDIFQGGAAGHYSVASSSTGVLDISGLTQDARTSLAGVTNHTGIIRGKQMGNSAAAPTTGTFFKGDIVWNSAPASGVPMGWVCTVAGTPGTWNALPNIV